VGITITIIPINTGQPITTLLFMPTQPAVFIWGMGTVAGTLGLVLAGTTGGQEVNGDGTRLITMDGVLIVTVFTIRTGTITTIMATMGNRTAKTAIMDTATLPAPITLPTEEEAEAQMRSKTTERMVKPASFIIVQIIETRPTLAEV
jgi:hypothetical protein